MDTLSMGYDAEWMHEAIRDAGLEKACHLIMRPAPR